MSPHMNAALHSADPAMPASTNAFLVPSHASVDVESLYSQPFAPRPTPLPPAFLAKSMPADSPGLASHLFLDASLQGTPAPSWPALPSSSSPVLVDGSPITSTSASSPDVVSTAAVPTGPLPAAKDTLGLNLRLTSEVVNLAEQALDFVEDLTQAVGNKPTSAPISSTDTKASGDLVLQQRVMSLSDRLKANSQQLKLLKETGLGSSSQQSAPQQMSSPSIFPPASVEPVPLSTPAHAAVGGSMPDEPVSPRSKPSAEPSVLAPQTGVIPASLKLEDNMGLAHYASTPSADSALLQHSHSWSGPAAGQLGANSLSVGVSDASLSSQLGFVRGGTVSAPGGAVGDTSIVPVGLTPSMSVSLPSSTTAPPHLNGAVDMWPVLSRPGLTTVRVSPQGAVGPSQASWNACMQGVNGMPPQAASLYSFPATGSGVVPPGSGPMHARYFSEMGASGTKRPISSDGILDPAQKRARFCGPSDPRSLSTSDATSIMMANPYGASGMDQSGYDPNNPATYPPGLLNEEGLMTFIPETDKRFRNRKLLLDLRPHLYYYLGVNEFRQLTEEQPSGEWVERMVTSAHARGSQTLEKRLVYNLDFSSRNFYSSNASLMEKMMVHGMELAQRHPEAYGMCPGVLQREHVEHVCKDLLDSARSGFRLALRLRSQKGAASSASTSQSRPSSAGGTEP